MKTTLDIPDVLLEQVKLRALKEGRKLKEEIANLLWKGLAQAGSPLQAVTPTVTKGKVTGLPLIECKHAAETSQELSHDRVAEILLAQEAKWQHEAGR